jgi:hypothetical protein
MTDLSTTITPKSDQLNADDLITEPKTIRVTKVSACPGSAEQPIAIYFEGDNGKPYKPCKSMRRVLVQVWGRNGAEYVGRRMTLFRDPTVQFGGVAVGGIRISHMSEIDRPMSLMLTASRASRKPYTVEPLTAEKTSPLAERVANFKKFLKDSPNSATMENRWKFRSSAELRRELDDATAREVEAFYNDQLDGMREREAMKDEAR